MRGKIDRYGWAVQGVERDGLHPPWAYTLGLTPLGLPEFVVSGLPLRRAAGLYDRGRWPWDVGYRGVRGGQLVLGRRAARSASAA